jgi:hypothetical protein
MINPDLQYLLLIVTLLILVLLFPPGPGTPLRDRVQKPGYDPAKA